LDTLVEICLQDTGRKVEEPELLEAIRLTIRFIDE